MSTAIRVLVPSRWRQRQAGAVERRYSTTNMLIGPQISSADEVIRANLQAVRAEIAAAAAAAHRTDDCITLVAVSKGHGAEPVRAAAACGVTDFGESYLQEALA